MKRPRTLVELVARNMTEELTGDLVDAVGLDCQVADFATELDEGVRRWDEAQKALYREV